MNNRIGLLEFGVSGLPDIRVLLKAWQRVLVREGLESSESSLVPVMVEDRLPGEEIRLKFQAAESVLHRFLQSLKDRGINLRCNACVPGLLTVCRISHDRGAVRAIGSKKWWKVKS